MTVTYTLWHGDCLEEMDRIICGDAAKVMAQLPNECIDLTVTSPPYDNLRKYNGYTFDFEPIAWELWRVTKEGGVVVWVVGDETKNGSESGTSFRQALWFMALGFNLHDTMIYQTYKPPLTHNRYEQTFEYMFVFSKGKVTTFNPILVKKSDESMKRAKSPRHTYQAGNGEDKIKDINPLKPYAIKVNIWFYSPGNHRDIFATKHPAPFPEALARDHILSWSNPGDLVLDPMCGSGTTCKMAKLTGRNYLGIDISSEYCDLASQRLAPIAAELRGELNHLPMFAEAVREGISSRNSDNTGN